MLLILAQENSIVVDDECTKQSSIPRSAERLINCIPWHPQRTALSSNSWGLHHARIHVQTTEEQAGPVHKLYIARANKFDSEFCEGMFILLVCQIVCDITWIYAGPMT